MLISEFKKEFNEILKNEYLEGEINSFFTILTQFYLGMSRLEVAMNPQKTISESEKKLFLRALEKLKSHYPIQYIIGQAEFFGYTFKVDKKVLIPRPETEELVQCILHDMKSHFNPSKINLLDIGTGSGCIAISLSKELPKAKVQAWDISAGAITIAKENARLNGAKVGFSKTDVLSAEFPSEKFTHIVSNPPYVRELEKKEMQRNVLEHEPELALYVKDENPLLFYRKITKLAANNLEKGGFLYFEINQNLAEETQQLVKSEGFETELKKDIFGNFRILRGKLM